MTGRRQPLISSFRAKREIFVIRGQMVNVWNSQTGNLLPADFQASPYLYFAALLYFLCAVPPFFISHFSFTRGFQIESKDGTPHWLTLPPNNNNNERTFYVLLISIRNDLSHFLCGRASPCAAAASCTGQHLRDTDPVCPLILQGHPYPADPAGLHVPHRDHAHPLPSGRRRPHGLVAPDLLYPSAVHRDHHPCHGHRHGSRRPFHAVYHEEGHKEGDLP